MSKFNLIEEPWIPCILLNGKKVEYGIRDVLEKASDIKEIFDSSPVVTLSIYRFILAILHRNFKTGTIEFWDELYKSGWDKQVLDDYYDKFHNKFYLYDDEYPFYQDISLLKEKKIKPISISKIARELSFKKGDTLFNHTLDGTIDFSSVQKVKLLLSWQFFALQDGRGHKVSPLTNGVSFWLQGCNLFETMMANLNIYNSEQPMFSEMEKDIPVWEKDIKDVSEVPDGYIDYLTHPYRRILFSDDKKLFLSKSGVGLTEKFLETFRDPSLFYIESKKAGKSFAISLKEDKAMWRNYHLIISLMKTNNHIPPNFINLRIEIDKMRENNKHFLVNEIHAFGAYKDKSKVIFWRQERLSIPFDYFNDDELLLKLRKAVELAEDVGLVLNKLFSSNKGLNKSEKQHCKNKFYIYWGQLGAEFDRFINLFKDDEELTNWKEIIRKCAKNVFKEICKKLWSNSRLIKEIVVLEKALDKKLLKILGRKEKVD